MHAGALLGESEELIDGYVVHHNEDGIQASWTAIDVESGIQEYLVGIGTARGNSHNIHIIPCIYACMHKIDQPS